MAIPPRQPEVDDKSKRFYVFAPSSVKLALHQEAVRRGVEFYDLGGIVIAEWLKAGCPDFEEMARKDALSNQEKVER